MPFPARRPTCCIRPREPPYFKISDTHYAATWLLHPDAPKVEMPDILKHRIARMKEEAGYEIG